MLLLLFFMTINCPITIALFDFWPHFSMALLFMEVLRPHPIDSNRFLSQHIHKVRGKTQTHTYVCIIMTVCARLSLSMSTRHESSIYIIYILRLPPCMYTYSFTFCRNNTEIKFTKFSICSHRKSTNAAFTHLKSKTVVMS